MKLIRTSSAPASSGLAAALLCLLLCAAATPALALPDLGVTMTGPASAAPGAQLTYSIIYTNQGIADTGVQLTDTLPPSVTPLTNTLGSGSYSGGVITWNIGSLAAST